MNKSVPDENLVQGTRLQIVRIRETKTRQEHEIIVVSDSSNDSLAQCVRDVLPELRQAGVLGHEAPCQARSTRDRSQEREKAPLNTRHPGLLGVAFLVGAFALAYKGMDFVLLVAMKNPQESQGLVKVMGGWLEAFAPLLRVIAGLGASVGLARLMKAK